MTVTEQMNKGFEKSGVDVNEGIPIVLITTQDDEEENDSSDEWLDILPLPASRYRYTKWYEIGDVDVTSSSLRSPRVRKGPSSYKKDTIFAIEEEADLEASEPDIESGKSRNMKMIRKKRKKRQDYRNKLEDWQQCSFVNLSYQELGHNYQLKEFYKVLRRLIRCVDIELMDNSLSDLHTISFPNCRKLHLQRNFLSSFKKLPKIQNIEHLSLQHNSISSFNGIEVFRRSNLRSLILDGNPLALEKNYRQKIFHLLPDLKLLDGLPKLPNDLQTIDDESSIVTSCTIS